ncbi:signal peptidase I [Thermococcus sp. GR6]|uniref:signal peptidase I n=1 Tax=Thermococcus sp. GR6 TaxID=1638256 RepID=UPI0014310157|nr:signal peptidase I [Thermococcus sp. GR6]NJE42847.1 signal peptidase I [Thermococcus sp. GR6]
MKSLAEYALLSIIGILVIGSLVGALFDRPVFMSYAYSNSMTPTIDKGDVFFINPLATNPDVGDVIVFRTGNTWTVHRVVAITDDGYITKGDNNIATDQQSHSVLPITRNKIGGTVVTVNGKVITIPEIGNYLETGLTEGSKLLISGMLIIIGAIAFTGGKASKNRKGKKFFTIKFKTPYLLASAFLLIMIAVSTFISWEAISVDYAVTSAGGLREDWYLPGQEFQRELTVKNYNFYPMAYYVSASVPVVNVSNKEFKLGSGEEQSLAVVLKAPKTTSLYSTKVKVNAYLPILPASVMGTLYRIHPVVPLLAILVEVSIFLGMLYLVSGIGNEEAIRIRKRRNSTLRGIAEVFKR